MFGRILVTLTILLIPLFFVWIRMRRGSRGNEQTRQDFLSAERAANAARRREIDPALFFSPEPASVPLPPGASKAGEKVRKYAGSTMIRFPRPMTNLELKNAYGPSQLELVAEYEENYNRYLSALNELAEEHIKAGETAQAIRVLEYALSLGTEYRKTYRLAADLYAERGDEENLTALLAAAERQNFSDEEMKRSVVRYVMTKREEIGA